MNPTISDWFMTNVDLPALGFVAIFALGVWVLHRAQASSKNNFDMADMLRDEGGKPSAYRLFGFVSLASTTWGLMYHIIHTKGEMQEWIYLGYAAIWSGSAVAAKAIDAYSGRTNTSSSTTTTTSSSSEPAKD